MSIWAVFVLASGVTRLRFSCVVAFETAQIVYGLLLPASLLLTFPFGFMSCVTALVGTSIITCCSKSPSAFRLVGCTCLWVLPSP